MCAAPAAARGQHEGRGNFPRPRRCVAAAAGLRHSRAPHRKALASQLTRQASLDARAVPLLYCAGRAQRRRRFRADGRVGKAENLRAYESGVALRLPPQVQNGGSSSSPAFLCGHRVSCILISIILVWRKPNRMMGPPPPLQGGRRRRTRERASLAGRVALRTTARSVFAPCSKLEPLLERPGHSPAQLVFPQV